MQDKELVQKLYLLNAARLPVSLMQGYYTFRVLRAPAANLDVSPNTLQ